MQLPSIHYIYSAGKRAALKHPISLLLAFIATSISIYLIEVNENKIDTISYINIILSCALGIPLFFGVNNLLDAKPFSKTLKISAYVISGLFLLGIYLSLPSQDLTTNTRIPYIRYGVFNVITHLFVAFSPFLSSYQLNGFWNFNKTLFIRVCVSLLYSVFLFAGISLAYVALDVLFDYSVDNELYPQTWAFIIGVCNTWFFLSGIPSNIAELETDTQYPKGLKIFAQYILLPLLMLYLTILFSYLAKILITSNWPKGIISYMIACVAVLGIFNMLLLYPYGQQQENRWIKIFSRLYYVLLIPLIITLFLAISLRIDAYGITINRYVIVALGVWLSFISVYFSIGKTNIKVIPISLAIIMLVVSYGPWGMFTVSEKSQANRLISILNENGLIKDQKIINEGIWLPDSLPKLELSNPLINNTIIADSIHNEIYSIVKYLDNHHGMESIEHLFSQDINTLIQNAVKEDHYVRETKVYMNSLGLKSNRIYSNSSTSYNFKTTYRNVVETYKADYYVSFNRWTNDSSVIISKVYLAPNKTNQLKLTCENYNKLTCSLNGQKKEFNLTQWMSDLAPLKDKDTVSKKQLQFKFEFESHSVLIQLKSFSMTEDASQLQSKHFNGYMLVTKK